MYNFTGTFTCSVDSKSRLSVPSGIRKRIAPEADDTLVFAPGFEADSLNLYTLDEWKKLTAGFSKFNLSDRKQQRFIRLFVGAAYTVKMDTQGRILIPGHILGKARVETDLIIVGMVNRMEVWNPQIYDAYCNQEGNGLLESMDGIALFGSENHGE